MSELLATRLCAVPALPEHSESEDDLAIEFSFSGLDGTEGRAPSVTTLTVVPTHTAVGGGGAAPRDRYPTLTHTEPNAAAWTSRDIPNVQRIAASMADMQHRLPWPVHFGRE